MTKTGNGTGLLTVLLMGLFITNVGVAVANVATPSIHDRLNASGSELQLVISGYILSYVCDAVDHRRAPGRHVRLSAPLPRRARRLHRVIARVRAGPEHNRADPVKCCPRNRRRAHGASSLDRDLAKFLGRGSHARVGFLLRGTLRRSRGRTSSGGACSSQRTCSTRAGDRFS
jgi:hypothetical protein